ncbi:methyltransferase domain-containing protein [Paraburkholderia adhaesiva]|uniref:methyltransferase domain-containing protein n=1 Tax=Paraburkholderia adhaesiva TaxID=2883244 RepID=UPI001F3D8047|nr:methyltransferase domain-containing protein [Paraburkholderia adhaesiva]
MHETRKSVVRRAREPAFVDHYFRGAGIDIGAGDDWLGSYAHMFPLMGQVVAWNSPRGDAVHVKGVEDGTYDFAHSSHALANVANPAHVLARWLDIVRPGGYLIVTVPDEDLYGKGVWPSRFNRNHRVSFTIGKPGAPDDGTGARLPHSVSVLDLVAAMQPVAACERLVLLRDFYDGKCPGVDQTAKGVAECAIEIVLRKREVPTPRMLADEAIRAESAEAGLAACRRALALYPYRFDVYHRAMVQMIRWGVPAEQDRMWEEALARLPDNMSVRLYHCLHEIMSGRLQKGFTLREARLAHSEWRRRTKVQPPEDIPAWTGEPLVGRSIVIWSEFGLGDEIFFFRFARILHERCGAAHVAVVCQAPLLELFAASGEADEVVDIAHVADLAPCDYWVYPHAIPAYLSLELDGMQSCVPYLRVPEGQPLPVAVKETRGDSLKVGIVTRGDPTHENDTARSLSSLSRLDSLFELEGVDFFSLQKGEGIEESARYARERKNFHDLGPDLRTMAQTAAAIRSLDLLLTVDTSVAHVAAAMGKPVWLMLPLICDWRWHYLREDSPWYPTLRIFRNSWNRDIRDWTDVVKRIRSELQAWRDRLCDGAHSGERIADRLWRRHP